jgi:hypothetical protein
MKLSCFALCSLLLVFSSASGQTPSDTSQKKDVVYQSARLVKMTASLNIKENEISHVTWTSAVLVSEKIVTYHFLIRSGRVEYTSEYTPNDQPGNLPHAWWEGDAPVGIRVAKHKLYIQLPDGREVASDITAQTSTTKSS